MFRITEDPSSRSIVQRLVKNYKNYSIVSVFFMEAYGTKVVSLNTVLVTVLIQAQSCSVTCRLSKKVLNVEKF